MGAQIEESVKTFFVGDSTGLVNAMKQVNAALKGNEALEAKVARSIRGIREQQVKETAQAPIRALLAEQKAADARVKLAKDTADKIIRQQKASTVSNLAKELRQNFGGNAKTKLSGALQTTLGLSEVAATGLVAKLGKFALPITIAATAGTALYKGFQAVERQIVANTGKMADLSAEMQRASRANLFSSSADSADSLIAKLTQSTELIKKNKQLQRELNPYGFGTGFVGTAKTMAIKPFQATYDFFNDGPFAKQKRERENLRLNTGIEKGQALTERKQITDSYARQNDLIKEGLQGSQTQVRIKELEAEKQREINALNGTPADTPGNKKLVEDRYATQIAAAKEADAFRQKQFMRDSQSLGISRQLVSDEEKKVRLTQLSLNGVNERLRTAQYDNEEQHQALLIQSGQLENELRTDKAAAANAESQFQLAQKTAGVNATNLNARAKSYDVERATLESLKEQFAAVEKINASRARGLQISIAESENTVRLARQDALFGKSGSTIQKEMQRNRTGQAQRDAFDIHMGKTSGGLLRADRDMNGNITGGIDPITVQYRKSLPGEGRAESGLRTGSLSDPAVSTRGGASLIHDTDSGGGLHSGNTPRMFDRTSASLALDKPTAASVVLNSHTGDPAHDPAARLANGTIFPDLKTTMAKEFNARHKTPELAHLQKTLFGKNGGNMVATAASRSASEAVHGSRTAGEAGVKIAAKSLEYQDQQAKSLADCKKVLNQMLGIFADWGYQ